MVRLWGVSKKNFTGAIFSVALLWYVVREREGDGDGGEERDGRRRGGGGGRMRVRRWAEEDRSSEYPEFDVLTEDHGEFLNPVSPELVLSSHYVSKPPSRSHLRTGTSTTYWKPSKQHLATPRDYFQYLHKPQFWCRKLIMIGGTLTCGTFGDESGLDGNKVCFVCFVYLFVPFHISCGSKSFIRFCKGSVTQNTCQPLISKSEEKFNSNEIRKSKFISFRGTKPRVHTKRVLTGLN
ncbi:uncharacterized protein LOC122262481 [Penaeus japonicus]|uniref:uncharacterized protein LOC122262481 n=1 Tax=Penaeus japonicus TaxID=27405 RepID=UPI001C70D29E|nr:uncharacterized protein LOC122262481 [Penaeus japonicus]